MIKNKLIDLVVLIAAVGIILGSLYIYNQIQAHRAFDEAVLKLLQQNKQVQQAP